MHFFFSTPHKLVPLVVCLYTTDKCALMGTIGKSESEREETNRQTKNASLFFKHSLSKEQAMSTNANGSSFYFRPHGDKINRKNLSLFRGTSRV